MGARAPIDDGWVPRISCQACGMSWPMKEAIEHDCTDSWSCPDCDYETVHPTGRELPCHARGSWDHRLPRSGVSVPPVRRNSPPVL